MPANTSPRAPHSPYVGRFAPSPSGPLHFGSAVAAVASFLEARSRNGRWRVRIDDLDPPREQPGAADSILRTLEKLGLEWDDAVVCQSRQSVHYEAALARLSARGFTFPCSCTRRQLAGGPYPGTCRNGLLPGRVARSLRVRVDGTPIEFDDRLQGRTRQDLAAAVGDFILVRADGLYAYHLACVVDDAAAGITEVVRGVDLLDSTPRQIYLQRVLGLTTPSYAHFPVVVDENGVKLSKQAQAAPIVESEPTRTLVAALRFLRQPVPLELERGDITTLLNWATAQWDLSATTGAALTP